MVRLSLLEKKSRPSRPKCVWSWFRIVHVSELSLARKIMKISFEFLFLFCCFHMSCSDVEKQFIQMYEFILPLFMSFLLPFRKPIPSKRGQWVYSAKLPTINLQFIPRVCFVRLGLSMLSRRLDVVSCTIKCFGSAKLVSLSLFHTTSTIESILDDLASFSWPLWEWNRRRM